MSERSPSTNSEEIEPHLAAQIVEIASDDDEMLLEAVLEMVEDLATNEPPGDRVTNYDRPDPDNAPPEPTTFSHDNNNDPRERANRQYRCGHTELIAWTRERPDGRLGAGDDAFERSGLMDLLGATGPTATRAFHARGNSSLCAVAAHFASLVLTAKPNGRRHTQLTLLGRQVLARPGKHCRSPSVRSWLSSLQTVWLNQEQGRTARVVLGALTDPDSGDSFPQVREVAARMLLPLLLAPVVTEWVHTYRSAPSSSRLGPPKLTCIGKAFRDMGYEALETWPNFPAGPWNGTD